MKKSPTNGLFKRLDMFGQSIPGFKIMGEEQIRTNSGAFLSMLLLGIVAIYGTIKFIHLQQRNNPNITSYLQETDWTEANPIDLYDIDFRMAFAFEGYRYKKLKNDPRFVKWIIRFHGKRDGVEFERILPHHECTEADYA